MPFTIAIKLMKYLRKISQMMYRLFKIKTIKSDSDKWKELSSLE